MSRLHKQKFSIRLPLVFRPSFFRSDDKKNNTTTLARRVRDTRRSVSLNNNRNDDNVNNRVARNDNRHGSRGVQTVYIGFILLRSDDGGRAAQRNACKTIPTTDRHECLRARFSRHDASRHRRVRISDRRATDDGIVTIIRVLKYDVQTMRVSFSEEQRPARS